MEDKMISWPWVLFFIVIAFSQGFFIGANRAYRKMRKQLEELMVDLHARSGNTYKPPDLTK